MDIRGSLSMNDTRTQLQAEMKMLSSEERQDLLKSVGITIDIPPEQGLAMKADLAIPWNKLRIIRRYIYSIVSSCAVVTDKYKKIDGSPLGTSKLRANVLYESGQRR